MCFKKFCYWFIRWIDFDGDNYLGKEDLRSTLRCLTRNELSEEEVEFVVEKVTVTMLLVCLQIEHRAIFAPSYFRLFSPV